MESALECGYFARSVGRENTYLGEFKPPIKTIEAYAKPSLKKYRPIAARNEDKKVFSGLL